jgi:hypothetical protein
MQTVHMRATAQRWMPRARVPAAALPGTCPTPAREPKPAIHWHPLRAPLSWRAAQRRRTGLSACSWRQTCASRPAYVTGGAPDRARACGSPCSRVFSSSAGEIARTAAVRAAAPASSGAAPSAPAGTADIRPQQPAESTPHAGPDSTMCAQTAQRPQSTRGCAARNRAPASNSRVCKLSYSGRYRPIMGTLMSSVISVPRHRPAVPSYRAIRRMPSSADLHGCALCLLLQQRAARTRHAVPRAACPVTAAGDNLARGVRLPVRVRLVVAATALRGWYRPRTRWVGARQRQARATPCGPAQRRCAFKRPPLLRRCPSTCASTPTLVRHRLGIFQTNFARRNHRARMRMRTHCGYEQAAPDVDAVPDAACTCMRVCGAHARGLAEPQVSAAQHVSIPKLPAAPGSDAGSASAVLTFTTSKGATTRLASADAVPAAAALSKTPASEAIMTGPNAQLLRRPRTPPEVRAGRQAHKDADCALVAPWHRAF